MTAGGNYGWGRFEGTTLKDSSVTLAPENPIATDPSFEYGRTEGETVVGGFVYRGSGIPELQGKYVFADFGRQVASIQKSSPARLFYADVDAVSGELLGNTVREFAISSSGVPLMLDDPADPLMVNGQSITFIFSIAEDIDGELYLLVGDDPGAPLALNPDGRILRLSDSDEDGDFDEDGDIDGLDFLLWQRDPNVGSLAVWEANYGTTSIQPGDFDANGEANGLDFLHWQRDPIVGSLADWESNYGMVATPSASSTAVPEPTTSALALAALCLAMSRRRAH